MKFDIIVIDPPYEFGDKLAMSDVKRGAEANYKTLTNEDLLKLPIKNIANPDGALLALWVPSSLLPLGLELMKVWGFEMKQTYIWAKIKKEPLTEIKDNVLNMIENVIFENLSFDAASEMLSEFFNKSKTALYNSLGFGMGRLFRASHEICLIGINDTKIYKYLQNKSQRSVCFAENIKHSAKPEELQNSLDLMFPEAKKIEVFARRSREGWFTIGNEAPATIGQDVRDSLNKIINVEKFSFDAFKLDFCNIKEFQ